MPKDVKSCQKLLKDSKSCQKLPKYFKGCQKKARKKERKKERKNEREMEGGREGRRNPMRKSPRGPWPYLHRNQQQIPAEEMNLSPPSNLAAPVRNDFYTVRRVHPSTRSKAPGGAASPPGGRPGGFHRAAGRVPPGGRAGSTAAPR